MSPEMKTEWHLTRSRFGGLLLCCETKDGLEISQLRAACSLIFSRDRSDAEMRSDCDIWRQAAHESPGRIAQHIYPPTTEGMRRIDYWYLSSPFHHHNLYKLCTKQCWSLFSGRGVDSAAYNNDESIRVSSNLLSALSVYLMSRTGAKEEKGR